MQAQDIANQNGRAAITAGFATRTAGAAAEFKDASGKVTTQTPQAANPSSNVAVGMADQMKDTTIAAKVTTGIAPTETSAP